MGITFAIFRLFGYTPVAMARLKIFTRAGTRMGEDNLINLVEYSSGPAELLFLRFFIVLFNSNSVIFCSSIECWTGSPRYLLKSELFWFENLFAKFSPISLKKLLKECDKSWGSVNVLLSIIRLLIFCVIFYFC